jgi:hypothetical protein
MARVIIVAQETGGIGKSTMTRGLAEAVEEASIIELESVHRLTEFKQDDANVAGGVRWFEMRATREKIEESSGQAAREELDPVINALYAVTQPTILDLGANQSASLFGVIPDIAADLRRLGVEIAVLVVAAAEDGALADVSKLLRLAKEWSAARFVVANEVRGLIDPDVLREAARGSAVTTLRRFDFDNETRSMLGASALRGIRSIDRDALIREKSPAVANRILKDLTAFRLAVMQAVKPAALWLIDANGK